MSSTTPNPAAEAVLSAWKDEYGKPMTEAAVLARCRRMCEEKAKGRLNVPEWLHQKWKSDQKGLAKLLHDSGFDKACRHVRKV